MMISVPLGTAQKVNSSREGAVPSGKSVDVHSWTTRSPSLSSRNLAENILVPSGEFAADNGFACGFGACESRLLFGVDVGVVDLFGGRVRDCYGLFYGCYFLLVQNISDHYSI